MTDHSNNSINLYTWGVSTFAAVGSLLYGIDSGIISTTIAQDTFLEYFAPFDPSIKGAVVSTFGAGSFFGVLLAGWSADKYGRKRTIQFAALVALISGIVQAAAVDVSMLIVGRILGGFAVGIMNLTIPIYNSEIAPPSKRGMVTGLHAQFVGFGFAAANWIGFGSGYASGSFKWRFPLAFQCVPAIILLLGSYWLPFSPRWLLERERDEEAFEIIKRLHSGSGRNDVELRMEFDRMREQIRYDNAVNVRSVRELVTKKSYRKRLALAITVQVFTQLSGINVINYYQTDLYKSVGITGHTVNLLAGCYGMVGPLANIICLLYVDTWGRKKSLYITGLLMAIDMSLIMSLTAAFATGTNRVGQGWAIAFIFLFSIIYSMGFNSIHIIYVPEILNQAIRAQGSSLSIMCNVLINILFNQVSPIAFANIGWRYYSVFIVTNVLGAVTVWSWFPETKGRSLEEVGALFGEEIVVESDIAAAKLAVAEEEEVGIARRGT
ncbi:uncharacterized protein LAJ45_11426 [Morchella importuna]|uniref:MFS transporter n=1 Tax=Morchella conica CCBAS932 TaxID=1392247 RepID=A0A3N4L1Y5_9PEZI|nr:uncharacterized protein LAJ45_11426 [Morchella importuna]KAH8144591.1 hypothetical protein LAJ45_11426 [Morchella importuna]RPB15512.1 MFS transporter [Morchella conica CCBAS932]